MRVVFSSLGGVREELLWARGRRTREDSFVELRSWSGTAGLYHPASPRSVAELLSCRSICSASTNVSLSELEEAPLGQLVRSPSSSALPFRRF